MLTILIFWPSNANDWGALVAYSIGAMAAVASVWNYYKNSQRERTRWLFEMYQRFYGQASFAQMRDLIERHKTEFIGADDYEKLNELDAYLNFFEFVAHLKERGELRADEIKAMFDYSLHTIAGDKATNTYVRNYGYEKLAALLEDMRYS